MIGLLDFRSNSKSGPFASQPLFDYSKSRLVWISDPHCISLHFVDITHIDMSGTTPPTQIGGTILESGIWTALNDAGHAGNSSSETGGSDSEDEEIDVVTSNDDDDPFLLSRQKQLRSIKPGEKKFSI